MSETIVCRKCQKDSGLIGSESAGADAARLQRIGWIVKLPIMVGIADWFFACSQVCMRDLMEAAYLEHGVSAEERAEANKQIAECKARIPKMSRQTGEAMKRMAGFLNSLGKKAE